MAVASDRIERRRQYQAAYQREWRSKNRARHNSDKAVYYAANAERIRLAHAAYRAANKDKVREQNRKWRIRNSTRVKLKKAEYEQNNKDRIRVHRREYINRRSKSDIGFRLRKVLACRILAAVKRRAGLKAKKTMELLGCDIAFLRDYIAARFTKEMSWQNYGIAWQIDHIVPVSSFDLSDPTQQKQCFNYSNLQPLRPSDNLSKSDKMPAPHQAELI